ncbi:hypothetical protein SPRG_17513 [Saprolegnia parasitica CBS 223.65]|uniref:LNR domain-containing protein n=1 Tax=Saprolegnia parasitica (strain CBS 223.65) TaxID=695850 RepID=A0A067BFA5_SAPPC|nr:hypothetical protein SPRG_17513 [Saprolegnia parasitica CBS 223.65]KDO17064.1 hypothetical protein SPRG_17513 [Saprolegnia parasitica CBS 223.65]|eukprot:XP_012212228.1 hypothetical protein SPRG_17513 [Saprolegnia parasitica CBS 223.65]
MVAVVPSLGPRAADVVWRYDPPEYLFSSFQRASVLLCVALLHALSVFYLMAMLIVYWMLPPSEMRIFNIYSRQLSFGVSMALGLLHLHGIGLVLVPHEHRDERRHERSGCCIWHHRWYRLAFGRYGPFGLYGPLYSVRLACKLVLQLPMQIYRAYQMSRLLTTPTLAFACTFVLGLRCSILPALLRLPSAHARRWTPAVFEAMIDFTLSTGIPLCLIYPALHDYYLAGNKDMAQNHIWLNRSILLGRFVAMTSLLDVFASSFFFVTSYFSLVALNHGIRVSKGHYVQHRKSLEHGLEISARIETQTWLVQRSNKVFWLVALSASAVLIGVASTSLYRAPCPSGCKLQTYPWFALECTCIMFTLNCKQHDVGDVDAFVAANLTHVFDLSILQCHLPHGLSATTMRSLENVYALALDATATVSWDVPRDAMPSSLFAVYLYNMAMPSLPTAIADAWPNLQYLFLRNLGFGQNKSVGHWPQLSQLFLVGLNLTDAPLEALAPTLTEVVLDNNALRELPLALFSLPQLTILSLINNSISELPFTALPPTLRHVYLGGNPIQHVPANLSLELFLSARLDLRDTPFCNRLLTYDAARHAAWALSPIERDIVAMGAEDLCGRACNVGCHPYQIGNGQCNLPCFTPACAFDEGDCVDYVFPLDEV